MTILAQAIRSALINVPPYVLLDHSIQALLEGVAVSLDRKSVV